MPPLYLKPNAIAEPLFNQWYAWSYLIPPASAALYLAHSHLKILESFVEAPQLHQSALKDPAMRGTPFIHYDASRAPEIQALLDQTRREQADLLELAQAIHDLDQQLQQANGDSLEPLYAQIPSVLKGYVELVYDLHHHASMRLIEGLLYKSPYYRSSSQSIALYLSHEDARSFVLSTPRLKDSTSLHLEIPFNDFRLDQLFQMRQYPGSYSEIKEMLAVEDDVLFASLFTEKAPSPSPQCAKNSLRIRYFGHACILIETQNISILCDPLIGYQNQSSLPRYNFADLPAVIDYVLITHNHQDHVMFETLLQLRYKIKHIVVPKSNKGSLIDPSLKLILQTIGFSQIQEIDELEQIELSEGYIASLPVLGEHGDLNIGAKNAYWIHLNGQSILCAADSNNIESQLYHHLAQQFGNLDILFLGMECDGAPYTWAYSPLLPQPVPRQLAQSRRLDGSNAARAIQMVQQLHPQQVYIYAMGQEPWLTHITSIVYTATSRPILESNRLIEYCQQQDIPSERLLGCKEILLENSPRSVQVLSNRSPLAPLKKGGTEPEPLKVPLRKGDLGGSPIQVWLAELARLDIKFAVEQTGTQTGTEPRLKCNAPKGTLTVDLQAQLKVRKPEIIKFLTTRSAPTQIDLSAEAVLDPEICPVAIRASAPARRILLTGATGFLGAFLLIELLQQTQAEIYCLVRAVDIATARQKLKASLSAYGILQDSFVTRIVPVIGDLSQPRLGLSAAEFQTLAAQIEAIYHNGAWVHHTLPYSQLKATNVLGTQEILRLACQEQTKPLHFISTISVFAADHTSGVQIVRESEPLNPLQVPSSGYAQSKWVAEALVKTAQVRGLPVSIYRPGAISGHSQTGVFNPNDFLYRLIQGCIQLGSAPAGEMPLNLLPIDYVSQVIIYLSQQPKSVNQAFHLIHPQPASSTLLFDLLHDSNYEIQQVPYDDWRALLLEIAKNLPDHPLYAIMPLFSTSHAQSQSEDLPVLEFDIENAESLLKTSSITCPPIDKKLLKTYLSYLAIHGFIEQQTSTASTTGDV